MAKHADPLRRRRVILGACSWVVFAFGWWRVSRLTANPWLLDLVMPAAAVVAVAAVTLAWVRHNLRIYRRKGPRRGLPSTDAAWRRDTLGRAVEFGAASDDAREVRVGVHGDVKWYGDAP